MDALAVTGVVCRATAGAEKVVLGRGRGLPSVVTGLIGLDGESSIDIVAMESFVSSNAPDDEAIVDTVYEDERTSLGGRLPGMRGRVRGKKSKPDLGLSPSVWLGLLTGVGSS